MAAGADTISTISFDAVVMEKHGWAKWARLAWMACDEFSSPARPRKVLGGMGPTPHLLSLLGGGAERDGVDVLHLESCMDRENMRAAMRAIASFGVAVPVCITGEFEETGTMLDGATPVAFFDCARDLGATWVGVTGHLGAALRALQELEEAGRMPDAVLPAVFCPGSEIGWMETVETLLAGLAPVIAAGRVPRVDFVAALAAQVDHADSSFRVIK